MSAVFISYRRSGAKQSAYRLKDRLKQAFGADKVFIDLEDIDAGLPFADVIKDTIDRCSVILIVIGPKWLEMQDMQGSRRLDDVDDWVRQEIEAAMTSDARVIPVLVDGASELSVDQVPAPLREFAGLQAMRLNTDETYWQFDVDRLVAKIIAADPGLKPARQPSQLKFSGKVLAALAIGLVLLLAVGSVDGDMAYGSAVAAIVFSGVALALGIWGFKDVQADRARGRGAAIGSIVLGSVVGLAAFGSLPERAADDLVSVQQDPAEGPSRPTAAMGFDPNALPPTAAIPREPPETPDISGVWLASDGSYIRVNQHGEQFVFLEFEASGVITATGSGSILENRINSQFHSTDDARGTGRFRLSADGRTLSGTYTDSASGDTVELILSRR